MNSSSSSVNNSSIPSLDEVLAHAFAIVNENEYDWKTIVEKGIHFLNNVAGEGNEEEQDEQCQVQVLNKSFDIKRVGEDCFVPPLSAMAEG